MSDDADSRWDSLEAERMLGLIADPDRLRVFSALALGATTTGDIRQMTGLDVRTIEKSLARLVAGELVAREDSGIVRLHTEDLLGLARRLGQRRNVQAEFDEDVPGAVVLSRFIRSGRLTAIPIQRSKRLIVLDYLVQDFEPGRRYAESEVNGLLGRYYDDFAALRRYMVDEGLMKREAGVYWRTGGSFDV